MKRILAMVVSVVLVATMAIGSSIAYLTSTDEAVNVMTLGEVKIEQNEQERDTQGDLIDFTQAKPLFPAVYSGEAWTSSIPWADASDWPVANDAAWKVVEENVNVIDKFVTVTNTGKSEAYVRTIIAYEGNAYNGTDIHIVHNSDTSSTPAVSDEFLSEEYIGSAEIEIPLLL